MLTGDETIEVVDLSSGRVRWTRPAGYPPGFGVTYPLPMAVANGSVLFAVNGRLTSYNDRTGQTRWTDALMAIRLAASLGTLGVQAGAGLVYLTGVAPQGASGQSAQVLLGISVADGHVKWQFASSPPRTLGIYAPGLVSVTSGSGGTRQDELDPATGRVRWQVASAYQAIATPVSIISASGPRSADQVSVRDTLTGRVHWTATLPWLNPRWPPPPALPVFPAGPLLIVPAAGLAGPGPLTALRMADGDRAWQITIPEPVAAPPTAVPGGMLVYSADLLLAP
jgi:outer membrane protein assembly factor BamB